MEVDRIEMPESVNGMTVHSMGHVYQVVLDEDCLLEVEDIDCTNVEMGLRDIETAGLVIVTDNANYKIIKNRYFKTGMLTIDEELSGKAVFYILKALSIGVVVGLGIGFFIGLGR